MKTALVILGLLVAAQCMPINDVERSNAEAENCKGVSKRDEQADDALKRAAEESKPTGAAKEEPKPTGTTTDKKSKREATVQDTKAETTDKNGVAVAQSTMVTVKDDDKAKSHTKRTTVQNTEAKGHTSVALGNIDATHKNKGEALIQTTKSTGEKIAIATSKITMGSSKHTLVVKPPAKPTEAPAKPTEAPAKPAEVTTTPAAAPEASSPAATEAPVAATEAPAAPAAPEAAPAAPEAPAAAPADPSAPVTSSADATSSVEINAAPEHSSVTV